MISLNLNQVIPIMILIKNDILYIIAFLIQEKNPIIKFLNHKQYIIIVILKNKIVL